MRKFTIFAVMTVSMVAFASFAYAGTVTISNGCVDTYSATAYSCKTGDSGCWLGMRKANGNQTVSFTVNGIIKRIETDLGGATQYWYSDGATNVIIVGTPEVRTYSWGAVVTVCNLKISPN